MRTGGIVVAVLWVVTALSSVCVPGVMAGCQRCWSLLCSSAVLLPEEWDCTERITAGVDFLPSVATNVNCSLAVRQQICNFLKYQSASAQVTECAPQYMRGMCLSSCQALSGCLLNPTLFACDASHVDPSNVTCLPAPRNGFMPASAPEPRPCPNFLRGRNQYSAEAYAWLELGFAGVLARSDPNAPPIELVKQPDRSTSELFPSDCHNKIVNGESGSGFEAFLIIWSIFMAATLALAAYRWRYQPLKVRDPIVVGANVLFGWLARVALEQININGRTASCAFALGGAYIVFPLLVWSLVMRTFSLIFQYRINEAKQKPTAVQDWAWFNRLRWMFRWRGSCALLLAPSLFLVILYLTASPYSRGEDFLSSGRCEWWDFSPSAPITAYALARGIDLGPTGLNPTGMAPYSVHFSSCAFCPIPVPMSACGVVLNYSGIILLMIALWYLRGVSDTFGIWQELFCCNLLIIVITPLATMSLFTQYQQVWLSHSVTWNYFIMDLFLMSLYVLHIVYPLWLTYRPENVKQYAQSLRALQQQLEDQSTTRVISSSHASGSGSSAGGSTTSGSTAIKKAVRPDGTVELELRDILLDPTTLEHFREFSRKNFDVENVEFLVELNAYKNLPADNRYAEGRALFEKFIRVGAPLELNIDPIERQELIDFYKSGVPPPRAPARTVASSMSVVAAATAHPFAGVMAPPPSAKSSIAGTAGDSATNGNGNSAGNGGGEVALVAFGQTIHESNAPPTAASVFVEVSAAVHSDGTMSGRLSVAPTSTTPTAAATARAAAADATAPPLTRLDSGGAPVPPPPPIGDMADGDEAGNKEFERHAEIDAPSVGHALAAAAAEQKAAGDAVEASEAKSAAAAGSVGGALDLPDVNLIIREGARFKRLSSVYSTGSVTGSGIIAIRARAQWKANRHSEFDRVRRTIERLIDTNSWLRFKASDQYSLAVAHVLRRHEQEKAGATKTSLAADVALDAIDE